MKQASEYFARALKANPESYMAHVNLGNIYFVHGLREEAIKEYEDALKSGANLPAIQQRVSELRRQRSEGE